MVEVKSICWNYQGNPANGSINFHSESFRKPDSMIFTPDKGIIRGEAVFILSLCTNCIVNIVLTCEVGLDYLGPFAFFLNNVNIYEQDNVIIRGGEDTDLSFFIPLPQIRLYVEAINMKYSLEFDRFPIGTHLLTAYMLKNTPITPWNVLTEFYVKAHNDYIFIDLLALLSKYPIDASMDEATAVKNIIHLLNESGMYYDVLQGAPYYTDTNGRCKLVKFFTDLQSPLKGKLNCVDCATLASVFAAALGIELPMTRIGNNFRCNPIRAIGWTDWEEPFNGNGFSFHQLNMQPQATLPQPLDWNIHIFDACLHINASEYPNSPNAPVPYLCTGLDFSVAGAGLQVQINTPYIDRVYRERLVANGADCCFLNMLDYVNAFTDVMTVGASNMKSNMIYIKKMIEQYSLSEDSFVHSQQNIFGYRLEDAENTETLDEANNFTEKRVTVKGKKYLIRHLWETECDILFLLASYVSSIAAPIKAADSDYPGERCFIVNDCGYIFTRRGNLYHVFGEEENDALDIARSVDFNTL